MPKIKAKILIADSDPTKRKVTLECNGKVPDVGSIVTLSWGRVRSLKQNSIYWLLLTWYIEHGGLKDQGYMFPEELHNALKGRLLSRIETKGKFQTRVIGSTTNLKADEFMDYIEKCEHIIMEHCGVSAAPFWKEYQDDYMENK